MAPKQKTSGLVVQESEKQTWADEAPVHAETGTGLKLTFVDGKNPEVRNISIANIAGDVSDPSGPAA